MLYPEVPAAYSRKKINMSHLCLFVSSWHVPNTKRNQLSNWSWNFPENFSDLIHQTKTTPPNQHSPCNFAAIPANSFICRNYGWNIPPALEIHFHSMTFVLLRILFATRKGWLPFGLQKLISSQTKKNFWHEQSHCWHLRIVSRVDANGVPFFVWLKIQLNGIQRPLASTFQHHSDSNTAAKLAHCWPLLEGFLGKYLQVARLRRPKCSESTLGGLGFGDHTNHGEIWTVNLSHLILKRLHFHKTHQNKESVMADSSFHRSNCLEPFRSLRITFQSAEDIPNVVMILSKGMWNHSQRKAFRIRK